MKIYIDGEFYEKADAKVSVMEDVLALDGTALRALSDLEAACRRHGARLMLADLHSQRAPRLTRPDSRPPDIAPSVSVENPAA